MLDSRSWRRLVTVLKKDSWTVGEAEAEEEVLLLLGRVVVVVLEGGLLGVGGTEVVWVSCC